MSNTVLVMCWHLGDAVDGDGAAREAVAAGWLKMVCDGLRLTQQPEPMKLELLKNLYGHGRILDELNKRATLAFMPELNMVEMLDEALPARA